MIKTLKLILICSLISILALSCTLGRKNTVDVSGRITNEIVYEAGNLIGLNLDTSEIRLIKKNLDNYLTYYEMLRQDDLDNSVPVILIYNPLEREKSYLEEERRK